MEGLGLADRAGARALTASVAHTGANMRRRNADKKKRSESERIPGLATTKCVELPVRTARASFVRIEVGVLLNDVHDDLIQRMSHDVAEVTPDKLCLFSVPH